MKLKKLIKFFAFAKGISLLARRPVRKRTSGLLKKYLAWKYLRRR